MYIHNQSILFQTMSQPDKLTVSPPHTGSLFSKTHAIGLHRDNSIIIYLDLKTKMCNKNLESGHLHVNRSRSQCVYASGRL